MSGAGWLYVVLVVAQDGTPSIVGTPNGNPFTSQASAERTADHYRDHANGVDAVAILVETGPRPARIRREAGQ